MAFILSQCPLCDHRSFHLARMDPYDPTNGLMSFDLHMWLNFTNLVASAFGCALMGIWSLEHVAQTLQARFKLRGWIPRTSLALILTLAASIGIYVGRFLRLHTAYLLSSLMPSSSNSLRCGTHAC